MNGIMLLANGFEDVEALATYDVLKRANINVELVSLNQNNEVKTSHEIIIKASKTLNEIDYKKYDFLIVPGGRAVFDVLDRSYDVAKIISYFCDNKKLVCAICAAPSLLGKLGYLREKNYTVFPGCGNNIVHGKLSDLPVVVDGNIITARSMYYSIDFALEIIKYISGEEKRREILLQIK